MSKQGIKCINKAKIRSISVGSDLASVTIIGLEGVSNIRVAAKDISVYTESDGSLWYRVEGVDGFDERINGRFVMVVDVGLVPLIPTD